MRMSPLVPAGVPDVRRRGGWMVGASLLLHGAVLAGLLVVARRVEAPVSAPSYELMFEGAPAGSAAAAEAPAEAPAAGAPAESGSAAAAPGAAGAPAPQAEAPPAAVARVPEVAPADVLPGPSTPSPLVPPVPDAPVPDAPESQMAAEAPARPEVPPPTEPQRTQTAMRDVPPDAPPQPSLQPSPPRPPRDAPAREPQAEAPALPLEAAPAREAAEVRLEPPAAVPPVAALPGPEFVPPAPPPALPPLPPQPPPRPRTAPSAPTLGSLTNPMDLSFRGTQGGVPGRAPAPRVGAAPGSVASRSIDLTPGAGKPGPYRQDAFFDARAAKLGGDWMEGVHAYWLRHRYFPRQAVEAGEDGTVEVDLVVNRYGRVEAATVRSRSGSTWIDMAAVGTFRGAQLPPIPAEIAAPYTVTLTINYLLLRR